MNKKGDLIDIEDGCFIGFDAEWTKNYKIKNGNIPFCFSILTIDRSDLNIHTLEEGKIHFKYIQYYCEEKDEFREIVVLAEKWVYKILEALQNSSILCGHQISLPLVNLEKIRCEWRERKKNNNVQIADTRYDVSQDFLGKSRRLVDMCNDFYLDVTQPELKKMSMTKLQNMYYEKKDEDIYERISVMNLRHSLCAVILYWLNQEISDSSQRMKININNSVYYNLKKDFKWIRSEEFKVLL